MSAIIHRFNGTTNTPKQRASTQLSSLIEELESCLKKTLSNLISRMLDSADDMLFQLAENATSNEDQNKYFDTMRMLRSERKAIAQIFATNLGAYLQYTNISDNSKNEIGEDELSLVDQDEMEEMVAVAVMHSKAMSLYNELISHLDARIEFLLVTSPHALNNDALSPKNICESFKDALVNIDLSTNIKLIFYKLFDHDVITQLGPLYKNLNQIFIDHDILPQIKLGYARNNNPVKTKLPIASTETLETDALYTENLTYNTHQISTFSNQLHSDNNSATENTPNQFNTVDIIKQFLNGKRNASGPNIPSSFSVVNNKYSSGGVKYYNRNDVMEALSNLQKNFIQSNYYYEQFNANEFKHELLENIGRQNGGAVTKQVSQIDEKTIDFVEMLFSAIIADNSISEHITNLLLKLQIPVIKVAFLDEQFFSDNEHPCRSTLNLIAYLGKGISSKKDTLFIQLNTIVETILNDFNIDIGNFKSACNDLEAIELIELKKTAEKEKLTQILALQTHAREVVLNELQYHLKGKILPSSAKKLILRYWSTLMFHQYIKHGKHSGGWRDAVSLANELIQLLQPIESSYAHNQLATEKEPLLNTLHDALLNTKQNPLEIEVEINHILIYLETLLSESSFNPSNKNNIGTYYADVENPTDENNSTLFDDMPEPSLEQENTLETPSQEASRIANEKISVLPAEVRLGVWFKVHSPESSISRRAKLSVIIIEEAKLIFVDRLGIKVIEKDAKIFKQELDNGSSEIIADHSAFDHALASVINSLSVAV